MKLYTSSQDNALIQASAGYLEIFKSMPRQSKEDRERENIRAKAQYESEPVFNRDED